MHLEEKIYYWQLYAYRIMLDIFELDQSYTPHVIIEDATRSLILAIEKQILTESLEPRVITKHEIVSFEYPKTWWDHFKYQYKDKWWMPFKRINIGESKNTVTFNVTLEPKLLFPNADLPRPSRLGEPVRLYVQKDRITLE